MVMRYRLHNSKKDAIGIESGLGQYTNGQFLESL